MLGSRFALEQMLLRDMRPLLDHEGTPPAILEYDDAFGTDGQPEWLRYTEFDWGSTN